MNYEGTAGNIIFLLSSRSGIEWGGGPYNTFYFLFVETNPPLTPDMLREVAEEYME